MHVALKLPRENLIFLSIILRSRILKSYELITIYGEEYSQD